MNTEGFGKALLELYRLARTVPMPQFQRQALDAIGARLDFDSAWWGMASHPPGQELEIHAGLAIRLHICHGGGIKHLLIVLDGRLRIFGAQVNMIVGIDGWHPCRAPLLRESLQP